MGGADGRRPIVVGVDPDPSKRLALAWAADEADRRALPLRLVHVRGVPFGGYRSGKARRSWEQWSQALQSVGERVLKEAVAFVESRQPAVEVPASLADGEPAWVLREEAQSASMVVVGSWHPTPGVNCSDRPRWRSRSPPMLPARSRSSRNPSMSRNSPPTSWSASTVARIPRRR